MGSSKSPGLQKLPQSPSSAATIGIDVLPESSLDFESWRVPFRIEDYKSLRWRYEKLSSFDIIPRQSSKQFILEAPLVIPSLAVLVSLIIVIFSSTLEPAPANLLSNVGWGMLFIALAKVSIEWLFRP